MICKIATYGANGHLCHFYAHNRKLLQCVCSVTITAEQLCKAYFTIILSREQKGNRFAINCAIREFGQREQRTEQYNNICSHFHWLEQSGKHCGYHHHYHSVIRATIRLETRGDRSHQSVACRARIIETGLIFSIVNILRRGVVTRWLWFYQTENCSDGMEIREMTMKRFQLIKMMIGPDITSNENSVIIIIEIIIFWKHFTDTCLSKSSVMPRHNYLSRPGLIASAGVPSDTRLLRDIN